MKVAVITGSREFPWRRSNEIAQVLEWADLLIAGCARGADSIAVKLAERRYIPVLRCRANWEALGKAAGMERNAVMKQFAVVFKDAGHEVTCYAFPIGDSHGTRNCMRLMKFAGIPVVEQG